MIKHIVSSASCSKFQEKIGNKISIHKRKQNLVKDTGKKLPQQTFHF